MELDTIVRYPVIPLKMPFAGKAKIDSSYMYSSSLAGGGINVSNLPNSGNSVANIELGFPEVFSTPITKNGKYLKRADVNALGYMSTVMAYRYQMGLPNEWNKDICNAVGGYPKNAVLDYCPLDGSKIIKETYKIVSLVDNNTTQPTDAVIKAERVWRRVSVDKEYVSTQVSQNKPKIFASSFARRYTGLSHTCTTDCLLLIMSHYDDVGAGTPFLSINGLLYQVGQYGDHSRGNGHSRFFSIYCKKGTNVTITNSTTIIDIGTVWYEIELQ